MKKREFIKGRHVQIQLNKKKIKIKRIILGTKEYYWKVPKKYRGTLKKGDLFFAMVDNDLTFDKQERKKPMKKVCIIIDEIFTDEERIKDLKLKSLTSERKSKKRPNDLIKYYIKQGLVNQKIDYDRTSLVLAAKCNLSEKSIVALLRKYDEEKVKRAVEMYLATEDRKAPLKFLKFVLEKI